MSPWILGSLRKDFAFFALPGLAALAFVGLFPDIAAHSTLYLLFALGFIDSGHVYTTIWRTYFHGEERRSSSLYLIVPFAIFAVFACWNYFGARGLWSFVVYSTLFHNVRQYYGFGRWYQGLNRRQMPSSDFFLYALCVLPLLAYHAKPGAIGGYYSDQDLFLFPNKTLFMSLVAIYASCVAAYIFFELRELRRGHREWNRVASVALPAAIYGVCFFCGRDVATILTPLVISHGIAYFGVMGDSLTKTQSTRFPSFLRALGIVIATALIGGGFEILTEGRTMSIGNEGSVTSLVLAVISALYLVPLYCHFIFDARIWRRRHREASVVFASSIEGSPSHERERLISWSYESTR